MKKTPGEKAMQVARMLGFTLVELMIVVAIVAILSAIAYPSYVTYITKSRRVAAEGCLSQYSNYMERYYTTNLGYNQDTSVPAVPNVLPLTFDCAQSSQTGSSYSYSFQGTTTATTYTVQAVPLPTQAARDKTCGTVTLNQAGFRTANGAAVVAGSGCW